MITPAIKIDSLTIGYTNKKQYTKVAQNINASFYAGELTSLIGPNGIGKSTLLRTISKLQLKHKGDIYLYNQNLNEIKKNQLATMLSVVLTERPTIYNITVKEMIGMGRSPYTNYWGTWSKDDELIISEAVKMVGVEKLTHRKFDTLSDGEKQKVMIAKALAQQTPIIILDEPTSFLDYPSKIELMQLLHRLTQEMQKTILFSTHDLDLALQVCDKMALMESDKIIIGTPEDLSLNNQLTHYLKSEGMTFDSQRGLFKVKHKVQRGIRITGSGVSYNMVQKALQRKGILSHKTIASKGYISIDTKCYTLHTPNNQDQKTTSIEQLLNLPELLSATIPLSELSHHKE